MGVRVRVRVRVRAKSPGEGGLLGSGLGFGFGFGLEIVPVTLKGTGRSTTQQCQQRFNKKVRQLREGAEVGWANTFY